MALVHRPDVLVLDEPSNSLDPLGVVRVRQLLRMRASEDGVSVLVSSQHLDEVARMADRIVLLHHGRILGGLGSAWRRRGAPVLPAATPGRPDRAEAAMNAALEFELLKARRAGVFRWGAVVVAVGVPALSTAFFELVRLGGDSPSAAKAATMITDLSLAGLLGTAGQVLSVAILMVAGIAASWSFGREFVDDALPALFAIATPRSSVAAAKFVVLAGWALLTVVSTVILTVVGGLLVGLDMDPAAVQTASRVAAAGLLGAALAAPMALVSSWRRGYLPGIVALMALVVVTQIVTAIGAGAWFPYAAPALWMGMGGAAAASQVSIIQLLLPLPVAALAVVATLSWWRRAEAR